MKSATEADSAWVDFWSLEVYLGVLSSGTVWVGSRLQSLSDLASRSPVAIPATRRCWKFRELATLWLWLFSVYTYPSQGVRALQAGFCLQSWQE